MSEPFVGEIRMFAGNFAPRGWAFCDGQLLAVAQNDALFSLLGTIYGGDGRLGEKAGTEQETLTVGQLPSHSHTVQVSTAAATQNSPAGEYVGNSPSVRVWRPDAQNVALNPNSITSVGGSQSHGNLMPFLCIHFIIALFGIYPSRQ